MKITNIKNNLFNGQLIAAPIDWIITPQQQQQNNNNNNNNCNYNQNKWILLPTIFKIAKFENKKNSISDGKLIM